MAPMQADRKEHLIRAASLDDLSSILEIERACATAAHWDVSEYRNAIQQPTRLVLVVEEAGQVLGFLVASTATQEWELENVAVSTRARRLGFGCALVTALIDQARRKGASEIRQEIRASNSAAQQLGQSVGFVQEGRREDYYRDPTEDALLFKY